MTTWTRTVCLLVGGLMAALQAPDSTSAAGPEDATLLRWQSGPGRVLLVELFTSEGCSSCPPAERWLSSLGEQAGVWQEFIPLAWHVDYWDGLGWRDPYADPGHASRQRNYVRAGVLSQVYTPGVLRGGREWRRWPGSPAAAARVQVGSLELRVARQAVVTFRPTRQGRFVAHVARVGFGLASTVLAGENAGRELRHDFVVLASRSAPMQASREGIWSATLALPESRLPSMGTGWVAWVEEAVSPLPVQATGGLVP